jgi:gas vesicle protein
LTKVQGNYYFYIKVSIPIDLKGGIVMETTNKRNHNFLTGLLFGGVLGGVAAFLLAPKSGKELRADIKETGEKAIHETEAFFGKAGHQASEARQRARHLWGCIKEKKGNEPSYTMESGEDRVGEA